MRWGDAARARASAHRLQADREERAPRARSRRAQCACPLAPPRVPARPVVGVLARSDAHNTLAQVIPTQIDRAKSSVFPSTSVFLTFLFFSSPHLTPHLTPPHPSPLTPHPSPLTPHPSQITRHLTPHLTPPTSPRASLLTGRAERKSWTSGILSQGAVSRPSIAQTARIR